MKDINEYHLPCDLVDIEGYVNKNLQQIFQEANWNIPLEIKLKIVDCYKYLYDNKIIVRMQYLTNSTIVFMYKMMESRIDILISSEGVIDIQHKTSILDVNPIYEKSDVTIEECVDYILSQIK